MMEQLLMIESFAVVWSRHIPIPSGSVPVKRGVLRLKTRESWVLDLTHWATE